MCTACYVCVCECVFALALKQWITLATGAATYFMCASTIGKNDDDIYGLHLKTQFAHSQLFDANKL